MAENEPDLQSDPESEQGDEKYGLIEGQVSLLKDGCAEDPFQPFDDLPDEDRNILTVRAIVVGILCGTLVNASNIYLGLKSGWTASANVFAVSVALSCEKRRA